MTLNGNKPHRIIAATFLIGAIGFGFAQLWNTKQRHDLANELEESPIEFSLWLPENPAYKPGDLIRFTYTRTTKGQKEPLLLLFADFFENAETGEIFRAASAPKKIRQWGSETITAARRVPSDCPPGRYTLEGLASAQTSRLSRTVGYSSQEFTVLPKPIVTPD